MIDFLLFCCLVFPAPSTEYRLRIGDFDNVVMETGHLALTPPLEAKVSLERATITFASAALADAISTYRFLSAGTLTETNPLLMKLGKQQPLRTVGAMVVLNAAEAYAWNRIVGRKHPKWARAGLYIMAAHRAWLAYKGTKYHHQALKWRSLQ